MPIPKPPIPHVLFEHSIPDRKIDLGAIQSIDSDPKSLPGKNTDYTRVPDEEALAILTMKFNNHADAAEMCKELNCKTVTFTGHLPYGFTCWKATRGDMYIYGHHQSTNKGYAKDKIFRSFHSFVRHAFWIVVDQAVAGNVPRGCGCPVCAED